MTTGDAAQEDNEVVTLVLMFDVRPLVNDMKEVLLGMPVVNEVDDIATALITVAVADFEA